MLSALTPRKIRELFAPIKKLAIDLKNRASQLQLTQKFGKPPQEPLITVSMITACMYLFNVTTNG